MKKMREIFFPGIALLVSAFFSLLFAGGLLFGLVGTHYFQKKIIGRKTTVVFNLGMLKLHFHHWLMGVLFLLVIWQIDMIGFFPKFVLGGTAGIICHDIFTDRGWYKVFIKK